MQSLLNKKYPAIQLVQVMLLEIQVEHGNEHN